MNTKLLIGVIAVLAIVGGGIWALSTTPTSQAPTTETNQMPNQQVTQQPPAQPTYSLAQVQAHKGAVSCWSTINGKVYDLTSWINVHPGGQEAILSICGKDGSSLFNAQHGEQRPQADKLKSLYIGELK